MWNMVHKPAGGAPPPGGRPRRPRRRGLGVSVVVVMLAVFATGPAALGEENAALVRVLGTVPHRQGTLVERSATGTIAAQIQSYIAFQTSGRVAERLVEVGQHVTTGQVLARLDPTEQQADVTRAEAALNSANAQLREAQITFRRDQDLLARGFAPRAAFDQSESNLRSAEADVSTAEAALKTAVENLGYTELRARRDGIIVDRSVEVGQVVLAGQTVFTLAEDGPRDAVFQVPEVALAHLPTDMTVDLALQSNPEVTARGEIREISPVLDQITGTVTVKVGIAQTPAQMTLGSAVVGRARWDQRPGFVIPWSALFEDRGRPAVWVLDKDDRVALRPVVVEEYVTGAVILASGLKDGERVVSAGIQWLYPGQRVAVVNSDDGGRQ
jgi:RND family efflux transporter MFP subunit